MTRVCLLIMVFSVTLAPVFAAPLPDGNSSAASATAVTEPRSDADAAAAPSAIELEIEELRDLLSGQARQLQEQSEQLKQQQQTIEILAQRLQSVSAAHASVAIASTSVATSTTSALVEPAPSQALQGAPPASTPDDTLRRIEQRLVAIGPFNFSGDFRLRDEPFFGGPGNDSLVRHRGRLRARFYVNTRLNDEISGGLALASGHIDDAISANQDLDQYFTRKPIELDRAFITYAPRWFKPLSLTGGKFAIPWYRTELTWDNDINVEGAAQTLNFAIPDSRVFKRLAVVGFELPFAQTTGVNFNFRPGDNNRSIRQSAVYGAQLQTEWQLANWLKLSAYSAFYNWHNTDPVALSINVVNSSSPNRGTLRLGGFSLQNSVTVWTQSTAVPTSAGGTTSVNTSIVNAQFASKFGLFDNIARFDIKTASAKWPVVLIADFVQNTKACANVGSFLNPVPPAGSTVTATTNAPCNPHDRQAYWLEGRLGRAAEKGDWQLAYTRMFIEREAVLGAYNFSDLRQNSNVSQHRVEVFYNAYRNVQLGFTGLFGRPLQALPPGESLLKRLQIDVLYRF